MDHDSQRLFAPSIPYDTISRAIFLLGTTLGKTWRFRVKNTSGFDTFNDKGNALIYALWHCQILPLTFCFRHTGKTAIISASGDGKRAAAAVQRWGYNVIAGSSSRGGMRALRRCVQVLEGKNPIVVTPDGPKGPKEIVKPGVAQIAITSKAPVLTVCAQPRSMWRLKSWDRLMIPKPFSLIDVTISSVDLADNIATEEPLTPMIQSIQDALNKCIR